MMFKAMEWDYQGSEQIPKKYSTKSGSVGKLSSQWDEEELAKETEKE